MNILFPYCLRHSFSRKRAGVTLVEAGIAMMVAVSALTGGATLYASHLKNQTNTVAAQQMKDASRAFERYVIDNYAQLLADAHATGWARVPVEALRPQYLSNAFVNKNAFGQEYVFAVRQPPGSTANLEAVVFTTGGEEIPSEQALAIAQAVGANGGFTLKGGSPSQVRATFDGYNLDLNDFGDPAPDAAGKLVSAIFMNEVGSETMDYLHRRNIPGHPELNRMETTLGMNGNDIDNVQDTNTQYVSATGDIVADGHVTGKNARVVGDVTVGENAIITASLSVHDLHAVNNITAGTDVQAHNLDATGNVTGTALITTLKAARGSSCKGYPVGSITTTVNGVIVSCRSNGIWGVAVMGKYGGSVPRHKKYGGGYNTVTGEAGCPPGYEKSMEARTSNRGRVSICHRPEGS